MASPVAGGMFGACHALEIPFVFDTLDQGPGQMLGQPARRTAAPATREQMHGAWVSFAARQSGVARVRAWQRATMRFDGEPNVVADLRAWETIGMGRTPLTRERN